MSDVALHVGKDEALGLTYCLKPILAQRWVLRRGTTLWYVLNLFANQPSLRPCHGCLDGMDKESA